MHDEFACLLVYNSNLSGSSPLRAILGVVSVSMRYILYKNLSPS